MIVYIIYSSSGSAMALHISLILITLFCSKALALICYNCTDLTTCTQTCGLTDKCGSTFKYDSTTNQPTTTSVGCVSSACVNSSISFGKVRINVQCCDADKCNKQSAPGQSNNKKNTCYTCNGTDCSKILDCKDDETHCFSATDLSKNITYKGCVSDCEVPKKQWPKYNTTCCPGNLCNDAQSLTLSLVLLLLPPLFTPF